MYIDLVDYFQACSKVVKFISSIALTIHGSLDGKNVEVVLTELGNRLHRGIFKHLQQFQYNSVGRFMNGKLVLISGNYIDVF
jgi:hypothetical protein